MKMSLPKIKKAPVRKINPGRMAMGHVAFPTGDKAFQKPSSMVTPDQAFSGGMAQPQGGAPSSALPALPTLPQG